MQSALHAAEKKTMQKQHAEEKDRMKRDHADALRDWGIAFDLRLMTIQSALNAPIGLVQSAFEVMATPPEPPPPASCPEMSIPLPDRPAVPSVSPGASNRSRSPQELPWQLRRTQRADRAPVTGR